MTKTQIKLIRFLLVLLVISGFIYFRFVKPFLNEKDKLLNLKIASVDISEISDGIYAGEYHSVLDPIKVNVHIESGRINGIDLNAGNQTDYGKKGNKVIENIIRDNNPKTDVIAGATVTSKIIMKAVEKALTNVENNQADSTAADSL